MKKYRLQVLFGNQWRWGIVEYDTVESANARVEELAKVGIKAKVKSNEDLFD